MLNVLRAFIQKTVETKMLKNSHLFSIKTKFTIRFSLSWDVCLLQLFRQERIAQAKLKSFTFLLSFLTLKNNLRNSSRVLGLRARDV